MPLLRIQNSVQGKTKAGKKGEGKVGLITTSRKPSPRTRSFARDLARALRFDYFTRGKANLQSIFSAFDRYKVILIVMEKHGNPSRIDVHTPEYTVNILLRRAILRREIKENIGYSHGRLAEFLETLLYQPAGRIKQREDSIVIEEGPEFRVRKILKEGKELNLEELT